MLQLVLFLFVNLLSAQDFDILIRGGRVVDGSGNPWYSADLGLRNGRIAEIGALSQRSARKVITLHGEVVAPGFIDMMGTNSIPLLTEPGSGDSKLRQGLTTIMAGEGGSAAPQSPATFPKEVAAKGFRWSTYAEYHALLESRGLAINVVHSIGAAQVRRVVIGDKDQEPTPAQLDQMRALVEQGMKDGAVGFSTALIYPPAPTPRPPNW